MLRHHRGGDDQPPPRVRYRDTVKGEMMELLHERLRGYTVGTGRVCADYRDAIEIDVPDGEFACPWCSMHALRSMADEIERDYIPKSVDANGKPWEINDPCVAYSNDAVVVGYGEPGVLIIRYCNTSNYSTVHADNVVRPEERTPIEKLRDEIASYAHSHVPDSVLDGWVKDLDAYIDQQGKDE